MLERELIPARQSGSRRLMIALHGLGDSMEGYRWLPEVMELPWLNYLLVNAPDPYYGGFSWYDFAGQPGSDIERSLKALFALLDETKEEFPIDQTVLFGFSQGCLMTFEVGLRYPHRFAGLIGVSGYLQSVETLIQELSPVAREQRFLATHGREDALIPVQPVREQMTLLRESGIKVEWHEFQKAHTIAGEEEIAVIRDFVVASFQ